MQGHPLPGQSDLEHPFTERGPTLDQLAQGVGRDRVGDAFPLDEGKHGVHPSGLDVGGVEADPRQDGHHRNLEGQAVDRSHACRRVHSVVHSGGEERLGPGIDLGDRGRRVQDQLL